MEKEKITTNQLEKYSQSAPFYRQDLILYTIITCTIILLFVVFIIIPKSDKALGFSVSFDSEIAFTFDFSTEELTIKKDLCKISQDKEHNTITLYGLDGENFNVLTYDCNNYTVRITDSNCPNRDCVDFFEINSGNGVIYCLPHALKILPLSPTQSEPSTGGRL